MNKLSMCCKADMIYLGKNNTKTPITQMIECYVNNKKETKLDKLIEIIKRSDK